VSKAELRRGRHLVDVFLFRMEHRWPDLDIDLAVESIRNPEKFPLVSRPGT
jgi:hypothetical protein